MINKILFLFLSLTILLGLFSLAEENLIFSSRLSLAVPVTPPVTPPILPCSITGVSYLDQSSTQTYIAQKIVTTWGVGDPLKFVPKKTGKIDKIQLYVSGKGYMRAVIMDENRNLITEDPLKYINSGGRWETFDFQTEPVLSTGKTYIIGFLSAKDATIYVHRGIFWNWAKKIYLKPCLN